MSRPGLTRSNLADFRRLEILRVSFPHKNLSENLRQVLFRVIAESGYIVNILIAGAKASVGDREILLAGIMQAGFSQVLIRLDGARPPPDAITIKACTSEAEAGLDHILLRRSLPGVDICAEIVKLAKRITENGDLYACSDLLRVKILTWASRFLAATKGRAEEAAVCKQKLLSIDLNVDTSIIDAWASVSDGKIDGALQGLQTVNTADARSTILAILLVHRGRKEALSWFDAHQEVESTFLTSIGWRNLALALAEEARWDEAISYLGRLDATRYGEFPDLYFADGVVNAAQLLPADLRDYALKNAYF